MPIVKLMDGGENEEFEAAFEQGVKFSASGAHAGMTKGAAGSAKATYGGSGGPGHATDFDALYNQQGANPDDWKGRSQASSSYAQELQAAKAGAYAPGSGWVSALSKEELEAREDKIAKLQRDHQSGKYSSAGAVGTAENGGRLGDT